MRPYLLMAMLYLSLAAVTALAAARPAGSGRGHLDEPAADPGREYCLLGWPVRDHRAEHAARGSLRPVAGVAGTCVVSIMGELEESGG